jgi:hypothetical protein
VYDVSGLESTEQGLLSAASTKIKNIFFKTSYGKYHKGLGWGLLQTDVNVSSILLVLASYNR